MCSPHRLKLCNFKLSTYNYKYLINLGNYLIILSIVDISVNTTFQNKNNSNIIVIQVAVFVQNLKISLKDIHFNLLDTSPSG